MSFISSIDSLMKISVFWIFDKFGSISYPASAAFFACTLVLVALLATLISYFMRETSEQRKRRLLSNELKGYQHFKKTSPYYPDT